MAADEAAGHQQRKADVHLREEGCHKRAAQQQRKGVLAEVHGRVQQEGITRFLHGLLETAHGLNANEQRGEQHDDQHAGIARGVAGKRQKVQALRPQNQADQARYNGRRKQQFLDGLDVRPQKLRDDQQQRHDREIEQ